MTTPTTHYVEYGGGLGDVFYQMYTRGCYNALYDLSPDERARVLLLCANPYAAEIFTHHPKADQLEVTNLGWWPWEQDGAKRAEFELPPAGMVTVPGVPGPVEFHLHPSDEEVLRAIHFPECADRYIVFAGGAGDPDRNIPQAMLHFLLDEVRGRGYVPLLVGRTFERKNRAEPLKGARVPGVIDLTDRLSVPGVARLVQRCAGVVCSHSAVNILAGLERRPQLLIYPESVRDRHIRHRDQWAFTVNLPETVHGCFTDWDGDHRDWIRWFFERVNRNRVASVTTVPYPEEARFFTVADEPRFTPERDLRVLLHLVAQTRGAIVEIGCHRGRTTHDIATAFPDRQVLAIDWTGARGSVVPEQAGEVPASLAEYARDLPNVHVWDMPSSAIDYDSLKRGYGPIGCIFIDGDLSDRGIFEDSKAALLHAQRSAEAGHPVMLVWHDYYEGAPGWCGVKRYVDTLSMSGLPIRYIEGTWIAYLSYGGLSFTAQQGRAPMETAKSRARREREGWFEKYAPADRPGLDVGCAYDLLHPDSPHWLQLDLGFTDFDLAHDSRRKRGDATNLAGGYPHPFHTVYASHNLEHLQNPLQALRAWWSAVEPGGHLIVCVPHYRLYEKRSELPSVWNPDHKWFWTDGDTPGVGQEGWPFVLGVSDVFEAAIGLRPQVRILDEGYDANGDGHPLGEFSIEAILQKPAVPAE